MHFGRVHIRLICAVRMVDESIYRLPWIEHLAISDLYSRYPELLQSMNGCPAGQSLVNGYIEIGIEIAIP
jgi:hypothetical protein